MTAAFAVPDTPSSSTYVRQKFHPVVMTVKDAQCVIVSPLPYLACTDSPLNLAFLEMDYGTHPAQGCMPDDPAHNPMFLIATSVPKTGLLNSLK